MSNHFLQIHTLTSFPASLLNRDDAGFAKRMPFGGAVRTRISSQCLKRHWRTFEGKHALGELDLPESIRSRRTFEEHVRKPLVDEEIPDAIAAEVTAAIMKEVLGESPKAKQAKKAKKSKDGEGESSEADNALQTKQITVLGFPEVEYLRDVARSVAQMEEVRSASASKLDKAVENGLKARLGKDEKANLRALHRGSGLSAALFGRMVTSDILAREDAAIHVAHAFTAHEQQAEDDYFSAIDDLVRETGEQGSGHINTSELTSGLFYGYVVVDLAQLLSNLEGVVQSAWAKADRTIAAGVVERLVHLIATVSPGAKRGSTAPYARANWIMVESGPEQPRSLANAFLEAVSPTHDVVGNAYKALSKHVGDLDGMYGFDGARKLAAMGATDQLGGLLDARIDGAPAVDALARWAAGRVVEAQP